MSDTVFPWTFDAAFTRSNWWIDEDGAARVTEETATDRGLSLTARVTTEVLRNVWRPLKSDQGQVSTLPTDDGGFLAVDRANGDNSFTLYPPERREPLRQQGTFHVERYEETLVSQDLGEWDVEVDFRRDADRTDTPSISQTPASDEWGITTRYGELATARVDADFLGTGDDGVRRFELTTRLTFEQAHVFEAALSLIGGTRIKEVPDGNNLAIDETGGDATVTLDVPSGQDVITDGDYVVTEWESERINEAFQRMTFTVAET